MRKSYLAALLLATLFTVAAAGTAFAEGWGMENNRWVYYLDNGSKLTDGWRTGADGKYRYLDSNGYMAVDCWVDNDNYYVDSDGVMLENQWLMAYNNYSEKGYDYYYLGNNGKVVVDKWQNINGNWYHFDDSGVMETGWILDDMYYCDENGVMLTGWQRLYPPDDYDDDDNYSNPSPYDDYELDDGKYWFYFNSSGKKAVADDSSGDEISTKKINGTYYAIDEYGALQYGWVSVTGDDSDDISDYRFVNGDGTVRTGWYSLEPPEYLSNDYEHDVEWFYFNSRGVPTVGPVEGTATRSDFKKISGYTYLFNDKGNPVYGLQKVYDSEDGDYTAYYFGTFEQSCMLTGKFTIDVGGENEQYYFGTSGKGYTGVHDNYLYYMGRLQKADSGSRYMVFSLEKNNNGTYNNYVVNTSGRIAKNTTVKDNDGIKYKTNSSGMLMSVDDDTDCIDGFFNEPYEPDWDYDY